MNKSLIVKTILRKPPNKQILLTLYIIQDQ